jgi:hypothetical protein
MSDSQDPEEAPHAPMIDHAPAEDSVAETQHSAVPPEPAGRNEPPAPPASRPPEVVRRGGTPFLLTLLLCAGLAGGIYWTWTHPHAEQPAAAPIDPGPAIAAAKADILQQLQGLADRVDRLEKAPPPPPAVPPPQAAAPSADAMADIAKRIDDLTSHLNALSEQQAQQSAILQKLQEQPGQPAPAAAAPPGAGEAQQQLADLGSKLDQALTQEKATLDALSQRLGKLETDTAAATEAASNKQSIDTLTSRLRKVEQGEGQIAGVRQDATLAVRLSAAQVALSSGEPLGDLPGAPPALARFATTPPPTEASLRADFPAVAQAALVASRPEESQKSLFSRALARLEQTITVRRGDHVIVGDPAAGVIAKAQQQLNDDDLQGAVQSLSALNGRAAQAVQAWVAQANALLAARAALAQLAAHG